MTGARATVCQGAQAEPALGRLRRARDQLVPPPEEAAQVRRENEPVEEREARRELEDVAHARPAVRGLEEVVVREAAERAAHLLVAVKRRRSYAAMRAVSRQRRPRCRASHVTVSPAPSRPDVTPPTARSPVDAAASRCSSTLRERSKQRSGGAPISVSHSIRRTAPTLLARE